MKRRFVSKMTVFLASIGTTLNPAISSSNEEHKDITQLINQSVMAFKKHKDLEAEKLMREAEHQCIKEGDLNSLIIALRNLEVLYRRQKRTNLVVDLKKEIRTLENAIASSNQPDISFSTEKIDVEHKLTKTLTTQPKSSKSQVIGVSNRYSWRDSLKYGIVKQSENREKVLSAETTRKVDDAQPREILRTRIKSIIWMSETDRELISHPTMAHQQVIDHYESSASPFYRSASYKTQSHSESHAPVYENLSSLIQRFGLSDSTYRACLNYLQYGGGVIELENGWVLVSPQKFDPIDWRLQEVSVGPHPRLTLPFVAITQVDKGIALGAKIIATEALH